jgi:hypothetical protein
MIIDYKLFFVAKVVKFLIYANYMGIFVEKRARVASHPEYQITSLVIPK